MDNRYYKEVFEDINSINDPALRLRYLRALKDSLFDKNDSSIDLSYRYFLKLQKLSLLRVILGRDQLLGYLNEFGLTYSHHSVRKIINTKKYHKFFSREVSLSLHGKMVLTYAEIHAIFNLNVSPDSLGFIEKAIVEIESAIDHYEDPKYLELELEVPDDISKEKLQNALASTVTKIDNLHRSIGGKGLKVRDLQATKTAVGEAIMK